jgi:hypothetical protein
MQIEPGIYRPEFPMDGNFTMIPNALIRDTEITPTGKLLLIYLLSHKIGYQIQDDQIMRETGLGRHALRTSRKHLEDLGFIDVVRIRHDDNSWGGYRYELADPKGYFSTVELSTAERATVENRPDNRKPIPKKTISKKTKKDNTKGDLDIQFSQFWEIYPKKDDKPLAKRSFEKALDRASVETILAGAERYRNDPNREPGFTKNPSTWLNADAWENGPLAPSRRLTNSERAALLARKYQAEAEFEANVVDAEIAWEDSSPLKELGGNWLKGPDDVE